MSFSSGTPGNISRWLVPVAFANIFIIWGSTFLAISYGLKGFPPFILSSLRFLTAGILLLAWQLIRGERPGTIRDWVRNAVPGILILSAGTGLVAWSEQYVSSSEAAILGASAPFWFIALDHKNWRNYFSDKLILTGLIAGFAGLLLFFSGSINAVSHGAAGSIRIAAFIVLALSSVSWVLGSLFSKNYPAKRSTVMNTAQQLIAGGAVSLLVSGIKGEWRQFAFSTVPPDAWLGLLFLVFMGSILAYQSYIWLLSVRPPALVSVHTYINPVVAVLIGWLFMSEMISLLQFIGLIIILAGVLLTNISRYKIRVRTKVRIRRRLRYAWQGLNQIAPAISGLAARLNS